jgi:hypothetical protein
LVVVGDLIGAGSAQEQTVVCHSACNFDPLSGGSASKIDPLRIGLIRCLL